MIHVVTIQMSLLLYSSILLESICVCFLCREEETGGHFRKDFHIFFVPRKSLLCEKKLKVSDVWVFNVCFLAAFLL